MIKTQFMKHLPGARQGEKEGSKENVRGGATARVVMENSWNVRVIEGEEVRGDDPIQYSHPTGIGSIF